VFHPRFGIKKKIGIIMPFEESPSHRIKIEKIVLIMEINDPTMRCCP